ncbi:MAG: 2-hydroxyacyl-CoA dehydratase family protein [Chloroflexota bacterium]
MAEKGPERFQASLRLGQIISDFYANAHQAKANGQPVAWLSTFAPAEIVKAMGVYCVYPEAHAATCGGRDVAKYHCEITEGCGFSSHLCTYVRSDIGSAIAGADTKSPVGGLPKPDFLVAASSSCEVVTYWFEYLSNFFQVPLFLVDTPFVHQDNPEAVNYIKKQLLDLIAFLEKVLGKKFDNDRFMEVVRLSEKATGLYRDILELIKSVPAPATLMDIFAHNFVVLTMRGTEAAIEHYAGLKAEVEERRRQKIGALPEEKYRLYWDNIAIWFRFGWLGRKLTEAGAGLIASTYSRMFGYEQMDSSRPLESIAEYCYYPLTNRNPEWKIENILKLIDEYSIDGLIFHFTRSCKAFTLHQMVVKDAVSRQTHLPVVVLEGDMVDSRLFNEGQANTILDALIESLEGRKTPA